MNLERRWNESGMNMERLWNDPRTTLERILDPNKKLVSFTPALAQRHRYVTRHSTRHSTLVSRQTSLDTRRSSPDTCHSTLVTPLARTTLGEVGGKVLFGLGLQKGTERTRK